MKNSNCQCSFTSGSFVMCDTCANTSLFAQGMEISRVNIQDGGDFAMSRQTVHGNIIVDEMMTTPIFDQPDIKTTKDVIRFQISQMATTFGSDVVNQAIRDNKFAHMDTAEKVKYLVSELKKMIGDEKAEDMLFNVLLGSKAIETEKKVG